MKVNKKFCIVADDFTGSIDTGVQLSRRGLETRFLLWSSAKKESTTCVIDTESRGLDADDAYQRGLKVGKCIDFSTFDVIMKKVDSTLRGNVPEEILALDQSYGSELVFFVPALPDLGRTTKDGIHRLQGIPIHETELAKDPRKPVTEDCLSKILQSVYEEPVIHLAEEDLSQETFEKARLYTFDCKSNQHLSRIVEAGKATKKKILWVGAAALADYLMEEDYPTLPSLALIGSVSQVTHDQIKFAVTQGIRGIALDMDRLILDGKAVEQVAVEASDYLKEGKDLVIYTTASGDHKEIEKTIEAGKTIGLSSSETSTAVQSVLGELGKLILQQVSCSGIFLAGGDTAIALFEKLQAEGATIKSEVAIGAPIAGLNGGLHPDLLVVTKAGAFGNIDIICHSFRQIKEHHAAQSL